MISFHWGTLGIDWNIESRRSLPTRAAFQQHLPRSSGAHLDCVHHLRTDWVKTAILSGPATAYSRYLDTSRCMNETAEIQNMPSKEGSRMINIQWDRQGALYFA